jgi:hypothetical protein
MKGEQLCEKVEIKDTDEYYEYLDLVKPATAFIAIVQPEGYEEDDEVIEEAEATMKLIGAYKTNNWPGNKNNSARGQLYMFESSWDFFDYLYDLPAFFFNEISLDGKEESVELTEFGINDIVFMDRWDNVLLYTNTKQGNIYIHRNYI